MKPKLSQIAIALACVSISIVYAPQSFALESLKEKLDKIIDQAISDKTIVGTVLVVKRDGKTVYKRAAGLADKENNLAVRENEMFRLASMTKPLVAACALRMAQEGIFNLDEPITKWLPYFTPKTADGKTPVITMRQLLTHTSGLGYVFMEDVEGPYHKAKVTDGLAQDGISQEENLKRLVTVPLLFEPGTAWHYSLGIDVVGAAIEKASGKSLQEAVKSRISGPLAMKDLTFTVSKEQAKRLAVPYFNTPSGPQKMAEKQLVPFSKSGFTICPGQAFNSACYQSGGSGMIDTASDYSNFLETMRLGGNKFQNLDMLANKVGNYSISMGPGWGFGFTGAVLKDPAAAKTPQGTGTVQWGGATGNQWFVDPVNKISVVSLTNTTTAGMQGPYPNALRDAIYESIAQEETNKVSN
jgi:CubicO group peptidase (beta-lactamase class C family)